MRTLIFTVSLLIVGAACVKSYATEEKQTYIYKGEKARNSEKNPCKGKATTICGTKTIILKYNEIGIPKEEVEVTETVLNAEGEVLYVETKTEYGDVETVLEKIKTETIEKGGLPE